MPADKADSLTLSRREVEALVAHFRFTYIDPNRTKELYHLVARVDSWLAQRQKASV